MCTDAFQSRRICLSTQTHGRVQPGAIDLSFLTCITHYILLRFVLAGTVASQQLSDFFHFYDDSAIKFQFFNNNFQNVRR